MNARRQSPAVYRRRRLLVLILALLVVAGIVWVVLAQPWRALGDLFTVDESASTSSESPSPSGSPDPDSSDTPEPSPTPTDDGTPQPCDPNAITVQALTSQGEYSADERPEFSIRLENTGGADCIFNVGTTKQVFTVSSGDDVWWRSTDCQTEPSDMLVTLEAGQVVTSAEAVVWDRTRSGVDSCDNEDRPVAPSGGASYHLRVSIGGIESESTRQFVLR